MATSPRQRGSPSYEALVQLAALRSAGGVAHASAESFSSSAAAAAAAALNKLENGSSSSSSGGDAAHVETRIELAAEAVHCAMHGHDQLPLEQMVEGSAWRRGMRYYAQHRAWHFALGCIILLHLSLVLLEPTWAEKPQPPGPFTERGSAALGIEAAILVIYAAEAAFRLVAFSLRGLLLQRHYLVFSAVALCVALDAAAYGLFHHRVSWRVARALRPLLLIARVRGLRRPFFAMARTTIAVAEVGLFAGVIVLFYSVWGMQLFSTLQVPEYITEGEHRRGRHDAARYGVSGTLEGLDDVVGNYDNVLEAFLATYTATSTENFPGIYYPALYSRPWAASFFFLSFMTIAIILIVPLSIAVVYDRYRKVHAGDRRRERRAEHTALHFAYTVLVPNSAGGATLGATIFDAVLRRVAPVYSPAQRAAIFGALGAKGGGRDSGVTHVQFLGLADVLRFNWSSYRPELHLSVLPRRESGDWGERGLGIAEAALVHLGKQRDAARVAQCGRRVRIGLANLARQCKLLLMLRPFGIVTRAAAYGNVLAACMWSVHLQRSFHACETLRDGGGTVNCVGEKLYLVQVFSSVCSFIGVVELVVKVLGTGYRAFFATWWNVLDGTIVCFSALSAAALWWGLNAGVHPLAAAPHEALLGVLEESHTSAMEILKLGRALRVMRLITLEKRFRSALEAIADCVGTLVQLTVLMVGMIYAFSIVGMTLFGGVPPESESELLEQRYRFDTFPSSALVLFQICTSSALCMCAGVCGGAARSPVLDLTPARALSPSLSPLSSLPSLSHQTTGTALCTQTFVKRACGTARSSSSSSPSS